MDYHNYPQKVIIKGQRKWIRTEGRRDGFKRYSWEEGKLKMIWSSFYKGRYMVLEAEADSLLGEWKHGGSKFDFDGGHAMLFNTLEGKRMISLHSPNIAGLERACFYEY